MANLISFLIITCLSCNKSYLERGRQKMTSFVCRLTWWYNPSLSVLWPSFKPSEIKWTKSINKKSFLYRCFSLHLGQIWTLRQLVAIHQGIFPLYWSWHTGNGSLNLLGLHHARLSGPPWRPKHHIRLHQVDRLPLWKRSSGQLFIWTKINREIVSISLAGLWSYYLEVYIRKLKSLEIYIK